MTCYYILENQVVVFRLKINMNYFQIFYTFFGGRGYNFKSEWY